MLEHVRRGDLIAEKISAQDYNFHQDAARAYRDSGQVNQIYGSQARYGLIVPFWSDTPTTELQSVTLGDPLVQPLDDTSTDTFINNLTLKKTYDAQNYVAAGICLQGTDWNDGAGTGSFNQGLACIHGICQAEMQSSGLVKAGDYVKGNEADGSGKMAPLDRDSDSPCVGRVIWAGDIYCLVYVMEPASAYTGTLTSVLNQGGFATATVDGLTSDYTVHDKFLGAGESLGIGDIIGIVRDQGIFFVVSTKCP
jgi:hypothetical protein